LAARQIADEDPVLDEGNRLRGDALVVPAECAHAAGRGRVGDDVDEIAAVADAAVALVSRKEARPGIARLGPEHAVELRRVTAALVDLEIELGRVEDHGEATRRALRSAQQADAFLGEWAGMADEIEAADI